MPAPKTWVFAEPTLSNAPLGWDIVQAKGNVLPELAGTDMGMMTIIGEGKEKLSQILKGKLHYKEIIPLIIVSSITAVLIQEVTAYITRPAVNSIKKNLGIKNKK